MVTLFDLPAEIRLQIYTLVLKTPATLRIKSQLAKLSPVSPNYDSDEDISEVLLPDFQSTSLLQVSSRVHDEALPVFFQSNTFNFETSEEPIVGDDGLEIMGLDLVRNISVRISVNRWWRGNRVDTGIGRRMARVLEQSPCARTLTIHHDHDHLCGFEMLCLEDSLRKLVPVIKKWSQLNQIKIVAFTSVSQMAELGARLAIGDGIDFRQLSEWPQISPFYQKRVIRDQAVSLLNYEIEEMGLNVGPRGIYVGTWLMKGGVKNSTTCEKRT